MLSFTVFYFCVKNGKSIVKKATEVSWNIDFKAQENFNLKMWFCHKIFQGFYNLKFKIACSNTVLCNVLLCYGRPPCHVAE